MMHVVVSSRDIDPVQTALVSSTDSGPVDLSIGCLADHHVEGGGVNELDVMDREVARDVDAQETRPARTAILVRAHTVKVALTWKLKVSYTSNSTYNSAYLDCNSEIVASG
jgi:hypothetical protein